ncbi:PREDICTED: uncharacterized protein LOC109130871 [Camelina sativa]|uniref:Uncharacterized protein LOC109130871 n=1 Tax=Camelina sativa TaxID=90675 RepID=A0ABM1RBV6_CAMSA|nr:PREDICTED: uncharacterized protein LOC109130871 [Camelina sativa]
MNVTEEPRQRSVPAEPRQRSAPEEPRQRSAREEPRRSESGARDPMLSVFQEILAHMREQSSRPSASEAPSFLKIVKIMKDLGTDNFRGGSNTFEADQWLQNLEKNFDATRCQEDYKKDVAVYYLKDDASDWWASVKRHYGQTNPTWTEFRKEFKGKYFPPEARDRLENEFISLEQGEKSVRELESIFTRLRKYVYRGREDEAVMARHFLHALRPDIQGRLMSVTYQRVDELAERAVNMEENIEMEKEAIRQDQEKNKAKMMSSDGKSRKRSQFNQEGRSPKPKKGGVVCYSCGESGHYFRECSKAERSYRPVPSHIICYNCGRGGHYKASCPMNNAIVAVPEARYPPLTSPEDEQPVKRQVREDRVYPSP